jgi:aminoglycoside phosphotransferase (APT) family kinase protein
MPAQDVEQQVRAGLDQLAPMLESGVQRIGALDRLSGGATQEIWRFELGEGGQRCILRRAPGGTRVAEGVGLETEAHLMAAAAEQDVPVAPVLHVLTPVDGLGLGFVMGFVEGETLGGRIVKSEALAAARTRLATDCGAILARIHRIPESGFPGLSRDTPITLVEHWRDKYRETATRRPVFDAAFRWLLDHAPPVPEAPRLVHGDFRNGNLMIGEDGIRAVLDWELAHVGDPMEDLAWIMVNSWRFGRIDKPVGGFGDREDLFAAYSAAGGDAVDPERVRWWEVFGTIRWGTMCAMSVDSYRDDDPTMERAMIARRTSETEIDLLRLITS